MIRRRATLLLGAVGLALLAAAAARVIYTSSGAGIVTLLPVFALALLILAARAGPPDKRLA